MEDKQKVQQRETPPAAPEVRLAPPPAYIHPDPEAADAELAAETAALAMSSSDPLPGLPDHEELGLDFADLEISGPGADTQVHVAEDGTVDVWVDIKKPLPELPKLPFPAPPRRAATTDSDNGPAAECPPLNIVIFVVGSRGDVQPYLALALRLIQSNGHRVRIATHPAFKDLVLSGNDHLGLSERFGNLKGKLEFFSIGGDPKELMAFMVKNPGLMPGFESLTNGDVSAKRRMAGEMVQGFYASCFEADPVSEVPFAADVIVSNPPSFAHIHVAEALGLPLVMSFTMPWSPTNRFAHPLVNVQSSNAGPGLTNYLSYALADTLMWQGLGDIMNRFRVQLGLAPLSALTGPMATERLGVPFLYAWSPALLPKADEWRENIDVAGFFTMPTTISYTPDAALEKFLSDGPAVYIGFGSIVVEDPDALTRTILMAVKDAGCRALVSAGWSDLGSETLPDSVFLIKGDIPHDWLFGTGRVSAVVHHGGAGTTSAGLRAGLPTVIIPFFGDQKFWGTAVALAGAGPAPVPFKKLNPVKLADALRFALSDEARAAAGDIGKAIREEDGTLAGVEKLHSHLPLNIMRCDIDPTRAAQWWCKKFTLRLSSRVVGALIDRKALSWRHLEPLRAMEYDTSRTYTDPITAGSQALLGVMTTGMVGSAQLFTKHPHQGLKKLTWGLFKGGADVVDVMHQGFENLPRMMGTRVRPRSRVDGLGSGLLEGGKALTYGFFDGITGLVTEPMDGYKRKGTLGAVAGVGTAIPNLFFRPLTGCFGALVHPTVGAYKSTRAWMHKEGPLVGPRRAAAAIESRGMTRDESTVIVMQFRRATSKDKVKARNEAESRRRREIEAASALSELSKEEREAIAGRSWWEQALPPPRLDKIRSNTDTSTSTATDRLSPPYSEPASAASSPPLSPLSPVTPITPPVALRPPPLPPRRRSAGAAQKVDAEGGTQEGLYQ